MKSFPSVASARVTSRAHAQLYVFVRGDDGNLHVCFFDLADNAWKWKSLGAPMSRRRIDASPAAVAYRYGGTFYQNLHITALANNGRLYSVQWSGHFNDQPTPWQDITPTGDPNPIYHPAATRVVIKMRESNNSFPDRVAIWTWVEGGQAWMYDGRWQWLSWLPGNAAVSSDVGVVSKTNWEYGLHWAYVIGTDSELYLNKVEERNSQWYSLGMPTELRNSGGGLYQLHGPAPIFDPTRNTEDPSAFVVGDRGLWELYWPSSGRSTWSHIGTPDGVSFFNAPAAVTHVHQGLDKPYIFFVGGDNSLYTATFLDAGRRDWFFHDFGRDPGLPPVSNALGRRPAPIVHDHVGENRLYVFAISADNDLVVCFWNESQNAWQMDNLGKPESER